MLLLDLYVSSCCQLHSYLFNPWDLLLLGSTKETPMTYPKRNINIDLNTDGDEKMKKRRNIEVKSKAYNNFFITFHVFVYVGNTINPSKYVRSQKLKYS